MRTPTRIAAFGAALGVVFGAAALAGASLGPLRDGASDAGHGHGEEAAHRTAAMAASTPGLAAAENGYRLAPDATTLPLARTTELGFRILDAGGAPVTAFDVEHTRRMHLIVVRRDLTGYQHLHPRLDASGRWSVRRAPSRGRGLPRLRRLQHRRGADDARRRPVRSRRLPAGAAGGGRGGRRDRGLPRRAHGRPRRRGRERRARLCPQPRRARAGRRRALPRRRRPPGRAARGRPRLPARAPRGVGHPWHDPLRGDPALRPGATVSSCSSSTTAASAPWPTRWRSPDDAGHARRAGADRAPHHGDDLRLVRRAHREATQPPGRRRGLGELRHRDGRRSRSTRRSWRPPGWWRPWSRPATAPACRPPPARRRPRPPRRTRPRRCAGACWSRPSSRCPCC